MSSRALATALLLLASAVASAADWGTFAAGSDRTEDPIILQAMMEGDLDTKILICEGLARRNDPFAADIIESLASSHAGSGAWRVQLLLRILLQRMFDPALGEARIGERVVANSMELDALADRMDEWTDPQLAGVLVRLFPLMEGAARRTALMAVGQRLVDRLSSSQGLLAAPESSLAQDYLSAVEKMPSSDSLEPCAAIARLSRDKTIVDRARQVGKGLLAPPHLTQ